MRSWHKCMYTVTGLFQTLKRECSWCFDNYVFQTKHERILVDSKNNIQLVSQIVKVHHKRDQYSVNFVQCIYSIYSVVTAILFSFRSISLHLSLSSGIPQA